MRWSLVFAASALAALVALAAAVPVPEARPETLQDTQAQLPPEVQERLSALQLDEQTLEQVTRDKRTIAVLRQLFPGIGQTELNPEENQLAGAESQVSEVRAQSTDQDGFGYDQDASATGGNDAPDPANADAADESSEEADRNKRQFQLGASAGSGGGSGNFLFDIIRLVSGGSSGGAASEASTDGASAGVEKDDGYGAGIPGPVTRLFIIANRGIANLVQDLILRIAQTSERLVNFKARLITSII